LALIVEGMISKPVDTTTGPVAEVVVRFLAAMLFFWWTMHFLLAGRASWRVLIRPRPGTRKGQGFRAAGSGARPSAVSEFHLERRN
jgi:hypothetical protein